MNEQPPFQTHRAWLLVWAVAGLLPLKIAAQHNPSFRVNSLSGDSNELNRSVLKYARFIKGDLLFSNETLVTAQLNYNQLSGQILFISQNGDTLEPALPETIRYIAIGRDTFHYAGKACLQLVTHYPGINLFKRQTIQYNGKEKKGAYGTYSPTSASRSVGKVSSENHVEKVGVDENDLYTTVTRYFLSGPSGQALPATKKSFRKFFPGKEDSIAPYLSRTKINFNREDDLLQLMEWLTR